MAKKTTTSKAANIKTAATEIVYQIPEWLSNTKLNMAFIAILGFLIYANTLFHDYTQDDAIVIYDNMYTTTGVSGISGILGKDTFYGFFKEEGKDALVSGGRYRPFTLVMFAIENQIFGSKKKDAKGEYIKDKNGNQVLEYPKFIGHLFNVLWYILTCVLMYGLLRRLLQSKGDDLMNVVAFVATILFVVHPIHTEAVSNIKGRDEIIALLGSLAALHFSIKAYDTKNVVWSIIASICFFIGLMSKENAIAFVAIAPLAYWFFTEAKIPTIIKQTVPFFAMAILFLIVRTATIGLQFGGTPPSELMNNPFLKLVSGQYVPFTGGEKLATIFYTLGKYVQLLFIPLTLTHDYYPRHVDIMTFGSPAALLSLVMYGALTYFAFKGLFQKSIVGFGILFFLGTMLIISNLLFPIGTNMSERFMFMPSFGFCLVVAYWLYKYVKNPKTILMVVGVIAGLFALKTVTRNNVWKDNYSLFLTDVETSVNSAKLQNAAGGELITQSLLITDEKEQTRMRTEAVKHLEKAIQIHPTYRNAYLLLGNGHNYLKNYEKSIKAYEDGLKVDPGYDELKKNLGVTYREAGKNAGEKQGDLQKALTYLTKAQQYLPNDLEVLRLLGVANGIGGNREKALEYFTKCITVSPDYATGWFNLSLAYDALGNRAKSDEAKAKAFQLDPDIIQHMKEPQK